MVEEETDQENWENHTINPIKELDNEEIENAVLILYIEEMKMKVWINAKGNMAIELAIKENEKKAKLTMKNSYWLTSTDFWMFLMKIKPTNSQSLMCGTTRLI